MKKFSFVACVALVLMVIGCAPDANDQKNVVATAAIAVAYENGVYYIGKTKADFGNALSSFIKQHPELRVVSIAGDGSGTYGSDDGYFIVTEKRK